MVLLELLYLVLLISMIIYTSYFAANWILNKILTVQHLFMFNSFEWQIITIIIMFLEYIILYNIFLYFGDYIL